MRTVPLAVEGGVPITSLTICSVKLAKVGDTNGLDLASIDQALHGFQRLLEGNVMVWPVHLCIESSASNQWPHQLASPTLCAHPHTWYKSMYSMPRFFRLRSQASTMVLADVQLDGSTLEAMTTLDRGTSSALRYFPKARSDTEQCL